MATYLTNGNVLDCTGAGKIINHGCVGFDQGVIIYVGDGRDVVSKAGDLIIDVSGKTVMPGLINMHEHLAFGYMPGPPAENMKITQTRMAIHGAKLCQKRLASGITTIRDMGCPNYLGLEMREAVALGEVRGPRIISCGKPISATGGHFSILAVVADGVDEVRKSTRELLAKGVDFIKVMASHDPWPMPGKEQTRPEMSFEEISTAYYTAHQWGKKTACHVLGSQAIKTVIEAGADVIDHGAYMTDELAELAASRGVIYVPTLSSYTRQTMNPDLRRGKAWADKHACLVEPFFDAFRTALKAGVKMVVGTDSVGKYPQEVELFRELGMSSEDSILCCTKNPSEALGLDMKIGTLEVGKLADIAVYDGNPINDPWVLDQAYIVYKEGELVYSNE